jgi:hypothetical protein
VKLNSGATTDWILANVAPNISDVYGRGLAIVLGKALLWCIFSEQREWVPRELVDHVTTQYQALPTALPIGENPISKSTLIITGEDAVVHITEALADQTDLADGRQDQAGGGLETLSSRQLLQTLLAQVGIMQRQIGQLNQQREADRVSMKNLSRTINENYRRLSRNPVIALHNNNAHGRGGREVDMLDQGGGGRCPADLSSCPHTLYDLWREYESGLNGRKAARLFTAQERGRVKHKYTRRKKVWDLIQSLMRTGLTYHTACDRIYQVYGHSATVTNIINRIRVDKKWQSSSRFAGWLVVTLMLFVWFTGICRKLQVTSTSRSAGANSERSSNVLFR